MSRSLRARLERLEKHAPTTRITVWDVGAWLCGERVTPAVRAQLESAAEAREVECARADEGSRIGMLYRAELTRLGLHQPETLRGIDLIEEVIRLTAMPDGLVQGLVQG